VRILNEEEYALELLNSKLEYKNIRYKLKVIAKYYVSQDITGVELEKKICNYCHENIRKFNEILWFREIESICKYAIKNSFFIAKPVRVTDLEYDFIKNLNNE